jgi:hypothetical protein
MCGRRVHPRQVVTGRVQSTRQRGQVNAANAWQREQRGSLAVVQVAPVHFEHWYWVGMFALLFCIDGGLCSFAVVFYLEGLQGLRQILHTEAISPARARFAWYSARGFNVLHVGHFLIMKNLMAVWFSSNSSQVYVALRAVLHA